MILWVREKTGLSEMDAYEFVSQNARAPITQMVDPQYIVLVRMRAGNAPGIPRRKQVLSGVVRGAGEILLRAKRSVRLRTPNLLRFCKRILPKVS